MCVCGGGGGGSVTSYIWHSADVACRMAPLFSACQVYDWHPFFNKKYMNDPIFLDSYVKRPHVSDTLVYAHNFRSEIF